MGEARLQKKEIHLDLHRRCKWPQVFTRSQLNEQVQKRLSIMPPVDGESLHYSVGIRQ